MQERAYLAMAEIFSAAICKGRADCAETSIFRRLYAPGASSVSQGPWSSFDPTCGAQPAYMSSTLAQTG
jgi:hypothetical protein